ncbi:MAG: DUF58 domain-containing protein [Candidatus Dormibacterales bacterium]
MPRPLSLGAGESIAVTVLHPAARGLDAVVADHAPLELAPSPREIRGTFDGRGRLEIAYRVRSPRRGDFAFGPVDVRCRTRSGLWERQVRIPLADSAEVYPDVRAVRQLQASARRGLRLSSGLRRARPPGAASSFAGLRDYLPGDDVRRIDWKATARRDRPVMTEFEAERGQQVVIALDCGRLMRAPVGPLTKLDHAVNAGLLLAWAAQAQGDRVGLLSFAEGVMTFSQPRRGSGQVALLTRILRTVQATHFEPDFRLAFAQLATGLSRRSLVVVLTDVIDQETSRELVEQCLWLGRRHLVLAVSMVDPEVLAARDEPIRTTGDAYRWTAAEEILGSRRESFERLRRGGVLGMDVEAGRLSPALVERYLELKERALI